RAGDDQPGRGRRIGVAEDDRRVLAAHLRLRGGSAAGEPLGHRDPGGGRAGERRRGDPRIVEEAVELSAGAASSPSTAATPTAGAAGLSTTALPYASAGAAFQSGIASGKFQGQIART